jgi:hypothetical protein
MIQPASGDVDSSAHAAADVHREQGSNEHTSKEALKTVRNRCALYTASAQLELKLDVACFRILISRPMQYPTSRLLTQDSSYAS